MIPLKEELAFVCRKKQGERRVSSYTCVHLPLFIKVIHASVKPEGILLFSMYFLGFFCRIMGFTFGVGAKLLKLGDFIYFQKTVLKNAFLSRFQQNLWFKHVVDTEF